MNKKEYKLLLLARLKLAIEALPTGSDWMWVSTLSDLRKEIDQFLDVRTWPGGLK